MGDPELEINMGNRAARRQGLQYKRRVEPPFMAALEASLQKYNQSARERNRFLEQTQGKPLAQHALQTGFSYPAHLSALCCFGRSLKAAQGSPVPDVGDPNYAAEVRKYIEEVGSYDVYNLKVKGVSLADIEEMPFPLSTGDLVKITRLMSDHIISRPRGIRERVVQDHILFTPLQTQFFQERGIPLPPQAVNLLERLTNFYDFYTDFFLYPPGDFNSETLVSTAITIMGYRFGRALGLYIPVSLGITPSSAAKLYTARERNAAGWTNRRFFRRYITPLLLSEIKNWELMVTASPLGEYQVFQPETDEAAAILLSQHYYGSAGTNPEPSLTEKDNLVNSLNKQRRALHAEIKRSRQQFIKPGNIASQGPIREILVASFSRKTFTFVLMLGEAGAHLTLDLDLQGRIFGLPPDLATKFPHIGDLLTRDIVNPVLAGVSGSMPAIIPPASPVPEVADAGTEIVDITEEEKPIKLKRRGRTILEQLKGEVVLPGEVAPRQKPSLKINHTRDEIRGFVGRRAEQEVDRIMAVIARLERGGGRIKALEDVGKMCSFRVGKIRVALSPIGGKSYSIFTIETRAEIGKSHYKKLKK